MTMPSPTSNPGDKTRKQLIAILVLLVLIVLGLALFLFLQVSRDRNSGAGVAEGSVSSSSESNAVAADDHGAGGSAGDDGGPNPTAGQQASGSGSDSGSHSRASGASGSDSSATTSGANSITGIVKVFQTRAEVLAYEQRQDPNPGAQDKGPYAILVLDQPTEVTAKLSGQGGPDTREIKTAVINPALHNDGERTTITFADDEYYWPSDPGVPSGIVLENALRN